MSIKDIFTSIVGRLQDNAGVKAVYGDPIEVGARTIIPVAKVGYGFGGGNGRLLEAGEGALPVAGPGSSEEDDSSPQGMGGGAGVTPMGVLEVTENDTRFVPIPNQNSLIIAGALFAGFALGAALAARSRRNS